MKTLLALLGLAFCSSLHADFVRKDIVGTYSGYANAYGSRIIQSIRARNLGRDGLVIITAIGYDSNVVTGQYEFRGNGAFRESFENYNGPLSFGNGRWRNTRSGIVARASGYASGIPFTQTVKVSQRGANRVIIKVFNYNGTVTSNLKRVR